LYIVSGPILLGPIAEGEYTVKQIPAVRPVV
jgi:hypothetical protein